MEQEYRFVLGSNSQNETTLDFVTNANVQGAHLEKFSEHLPKEASFSLFKRFLQRHVSSNRA